MFTRRVAISLMGSASVAMWLNAAGRKDPADSTGSPALAPGSPTSPERLALVEAFRKQSEDLEKSFEAHTHENDWVMPYRLFRPAAKGKLPLVLYLHGSGGVGDDNEKQLSLGNVFGTRVWLLPENQKHFPCYVLAPQTDRGWVRYAAGEGGGVATPVTGLGDGAKHAMEIVDGLVRDLPIDRRRIYVTGQSMGGAGVWNMLAHRPELFAGAVICCGGSSLDDGSGGVDVPVWNFHGDSDQAVPVSISRDRMIARRKAGGHPIYTEYKGVDHNVWQWAYTEPGLLNWLFARHR